MVRPTSTARGSWPPRNNAARPQRRAWRAKRMPVAPRLLTQRIIAWTWFPHAVQLWTRAIPGTESRVASCGLSLPDAWSLRRPAQTSFSCPARSKKNREKRLWAWRRRALPTKFSLPRGFPGNESIIEQHRDTYGKKKAQEKIRSRPMPSRPLKPTEALTIRAALRTFRPSAWRTRVRAVMSAREGACLRSQEGAGPFPLPGMLKSTVVTCGQAKRRGITR